MLNVEGARVLQKLTTTKTKKIIFKKRKIVFVFILKEKTRIFPVIKLLLKRDEEKKREKNYAHFLNVTLVERSQRTDVNHG